MADDALFRLAEQVGAALRAHGLQLATAESCTGGGIGQALTMVPGSSQWFERGFITYSNDAKREMLGVDAATLAMHGAVSEAAVREMVAGALARSRAQVAVAVSGVAGPGGGTPDKPVGMVCLAWGGQDQPVTTATHHFSGDRAKIREQTVVVALQGILRLLQGIRIVA